MSRHRIEKKTLVAAALAAALSLVINSPVSADAFLLGDVNQDGKVDLVDAQMTLKGALRISVLDDTQLKAADVDMDGEVSLNDTQKILRAALRIEELEGEVSHTHDWKEHTAERQVWVPNIVIVDDYEEQVVMGYYECDCGVRFPMTKEGSDALTKHQDDAMNGYLAAGMDPFTTCGNFGIYEQYETTISVKVGSHEEDHGHYENETYVDYYYCDCGATK